MLQVNLYSHVSMPTYTYLWPCQLYLQVIMMALKRNKEKKKAIAISYLLTQMTPSWCNSLHICLNCLGHDPIIHKMTPNFLYFGQASFWMIPNVVFKILKKKLIKPIWWIILPFILYSLWHWGCHEINIREYNTINRLYLLAPEGNFQFKTHCSKIILLFHNTRRGQKLL